MKPPNPTAGPSADALTTVYPAAREAEPKSLPRCRVAMLPVAPSRFEGQVAALLANRLRIVTLIVLAPSLVFLARNLLEPQRFALVARLGLAVQAGVVLVTALLAALVWGSRRLPLRALRAVELSLFGVTAAHFAWIQYQHLHQDILFQAVKAGKVDLVAPLVTVAGAARWFFLLVIYGVFIPNTWKRCALVVGVGALIPLLLAPAAAYWHDRWGPGMADALGDLAVLMLVAVAVAVFGSYRIHFLQEQAIQAQQLGQYRLKRRLGSGGMGEVYLAEHVLLKRPCAVKLIRPQQAGDPTTLRRFEREVRTMATLTHPNTGQVFDYGHADDGTFYYVMEYLPGRDLETLVGRHGPLPPGRAIHFLRQVCGALREAHAVGLLHRDIKPGNVIACERGRVYDVAKLLDFGLVQESRLGQEAGRLTVQGTIVGSPPYMSPEQAAGKALDARSDIYSLGAVAYFLLTGQPPFVRETAMQMLLAHAYEPVVPPRELRPDLPADLEAVVLRCLAKEPAKRYADADGLEKGLAACASAVCWGDEQAAAWWRGQADEADTDPGSPPPLPTSTVA